jgi:hypothetical protein
MISHGTSRFLKERLFDQSDPYQVIICEECGGFASSMTECKACKNDTMARVNLPYAAKIKYWQQKVALKESLPSSRYGFYCETPYNDGKSLTALNTTFVWKLTNRTRLIAVIKCNNFKDWVIRG